MLFKRHADDISKYSFIEKATIKGGVMTIEYFADGNKKQQKLPLRVSVRKLQEALASIRKEAGVSLYGKGQYGNYYII